MGLHEVVLHRILLSAVLIFGLSGQAWAWGCMAYPGGMVSEDAGGYTSFWGVPISSELTTVETTRKRSVESYQVEVLESYGHIQTKTVEVITARDLESAGIGKNVHLALNVPQFLSGYAGDESGQYWVSQCEPELPYSALKNYLENDVDIFIPALYDCEKWEGGKFFGVDLDKPECVVWKDPYKNWGKRRGEEDLQTYVEMWDDLKTRGLTPR